MIETRDYTQFALSRLLIQYKDSVNLQELLTSIAEQLVSPQTDIIDIVNNFNIDDAAGELLDFVGKIVGSRRRSRDDSEFRDAIKLRILFNTSNGTPDRILEALATATNASKVRIWEHYPLSCTYYTNGTLSPRNLPEAIQSASPATCNNVVIYIDPNEDTFIPSEIDIEAMILIDQDDNEFVTDRDDEIEVLNLSSLFNEYPNRNLLSEYTYGEGSGTQKDTKDGLGLFVELL